MAPPAVVIVVAIALLAAALGGRHLVKTRYGASRRFYPHTAFPALRALSGGFPAIKAEYGANVAGGRLLHDWPERDLYGDSGEWKVLPLYGFGAWNREAAERFPRTVELLKRVPGLETAVFSRLGPGTVLNKHRGWAALSNGALRCHLGVEVPEGVCGVAVEDEFRQLEEGVDRLRRQRRAHGGQQDGKAQGRPAGRHRPAVVGEKGGERR